MTAKKAALQKVDEAASLANLNEHAEQYSVVNLMKMAPFERAVALAKGMKLLRDDLDPLMHIFLEVGGKPLGFQTDEASRIKKGQGPYPTEIIRDCLIEATLRGLQPVGNQFNVIASRCYVTKEGFWHLMAQHPGLTELQVMTSPPQKKEGGVLVECSAKWKLDGKEDSLTATIPIKVDQYTGVDAIGGKATRKTLARVYDRLLGSAIQTPEGELGEESIDVTPGESGLEEMTKSLTENIGRANITLADDADEPEEPSEEDETKPLTKPAIKRIHKHAQEAFGDKFEQRIAWWCNANFGTPKLELVPRVAEADILKWIKRTLDKQKEKTL